MRIAAIEAGGTKFVCGLLRTTGIEGKAPEILAKETIPTTDPHGTLASVSSFLAATAKTHGDPEAIGIGSFGPLDLNPASPGWGRITTTPKPGWSGVDLAGHFRRDFGLPVSFDTDVNAAAYGEYLWGVARGMRDFIYLTVGTGIGGGFFSGGGLVHGTSHPEMGHIKVAREKGDNWTGSCPWHLDCLEGLASGPAIEARWGCPGRELPEGHEAWELEARYLARAIATFTLILSPERVILGGGIGLRPGLAERVALFLGEELSGYIQALAVREKLAAFVKRPLLGAEAGLFGAAALAICARPGPGLSA